MKKLLQIFNLGMLPVLLSLALGCATPKEFSAQGTVTAIERGKDGYAALLTDQKGQRFNAVISRVNLAQSGGYQELNIGDQVTVYGDTTRLGDIISVKVSQLKK
ncbi:MAG: hypothetical protein ACO1OF_05265 [Adhaeribacter sp.]